MSTVAYDCEYSCEASKFGKEFLRMAGIVQMLHAPTPSNDKYPYANAEGIREVTGARDQTRSSCTLSLAVPGPCATVLAMPHHTLSRAICFGTIWPILTTLLTARHYIVSVHEGLNHYDSTATVSTVSIVISEGWVSEDTVKDWCQKICGR